MGTIEIGEQLYDQIPCDELMLAVDERLTKGEKEIVLDFSSCRAISAYGLSILALCNEKLTPPGSLRIKNLASELKTLIKMVYLSELLKIE